MVKGFEMILSGFLLVAGTILLVAGVIGGDFHQYAVGGISVALGRIGFLERRLDDAK